jgi:hypothetical protein
MFEDIVKTCKENKALVIVAAAIIIVAFILLTRKGAAQPTPVMVSQP